MQLDYWCVLCIHVLVCTMSVWPFPCTYMYAHVSFCPVHADNIKYMYMYVSLCIRKCTRREFILDQIVAIIIGAMNLQIGSF